MKHRIQELAEQAGIMYGTDVDYYYTRATDGVTSDQMSKFAELIVQECMKVNNDFGEDIENGNILRSPELASLAQDIENHHLGPLLWKSSELIKQHFGIKE